MQKNILLVIFVIILLLISAGFIIYTKQPVQHVVTTTATSEKFGTYLTDQNGITLYSFSPNPGLETACDYKCLKYFRPFIVDLANGGNESFVNKKYNYGNNISVVKRADGLYQYTYDGKLLYKFIGDTNKGDTNGTRMPKEEWKLINL